MKVLVTGACGFIGSHLAERLVKQGHEVTGLARYNAFDSYGWLDECEGMEKVRGDVLDTEQMRRLIKGKDVVFHLAALGSVPYSYDAPRSVAEVNYTGTLNILEACRDADAKIVHTSTSEVFGTALYTPQDTKHPLQAQSPYAASKIASDSLVGSYACTYGLSAVILRPFNTYGPRQSQRAVIPQIIRQALWPGETISLGSLEPKRDFTYVSDIVNAFIVASKLEGGPYIAGSGESISIGEVANLIVRITRTKRELTVNYHRTRPPSSEVMELCAAPNLPGWKAETTLRQGLVNTIDWFRDQPFKVQEYMT